jgi:molybdopterin synthase sulfur carrier subunit
VSARLVVPSALRSSAGGAKEVVVEGATLRALLDDLGARMPGLERRIRDERGVLRPHVLVFVDGLMVRGESSMETPVPEGCEVLVAPAVSGGGC